MPLGAIRQAVYLIAVVKCIVQQQKSYKDWVTDSSDITAQMSAMPVNVSNVPVVASLLWGQRTNGSDRDVCHLWPI